MPDTEWHLDKRVPVALILTLLGQMFGAVVLGTMMYADIRRNAEDIVRLNQQMSAQTQASQAQAVQLGRIEESVSGMRNDINRLINVLERR